MLGLPRDCISLLLSLLGVAGAPALVLTAPASVALQDVRMCACGVCGRGTGVYHSLANSGHW